MRDFKTFLSENINIEEREVRFILKGVSENSERNYIRMVDDTIDYLQRVIGI